MSINRFPAELEYKRNPKLSKDAVMRILDWVRNQPYLPDIEEEDAILFLASCKLDEEYAKKTIDIHYSFRTLHPELFCNRDPLDENSNFDLKCGYLAALPGLAKDGTKAFYWKILKSSDLSKYDLLTESKFFLCTHEVLIHRKGAINGWRVIYDMDDTKFSIILKFRPHIFSLVMYYLQEASPIQLIGIHIIHPKPYVTYFINLLKPFLKKSAANFLQVHSNVEELYEYIHRKNLPLECGGDLPSTEETNLVVNQMLINNRNIIIRNENLKVQESLRPKDEPNRSLWNYFWD